MEAVLLLSKLDVESLISIGEAIRETENAFRLFGKGKAVMPSKIYLDLLEYKGDFRAMPGQICEMAGVKWVSVYPDNCAFDLPSVIALIILCDPHTGCPLAIMDGTYITNLRTGAAGGIAVKYLARKDSSVIGIIGAGIQAKTQLLAIREVLPEMKEVKVFDQKRENSLKFTDEFNMRFRMNIYSVETIEEATEADILVTTTPSRNPIIKKHYVRPGTHINAIGADARGKQELEGDLLIHAKIVVDDVNQASHSGEINVPLSSGVIKIEDIYGSLGEIVNNIKKGREDNKEITVFDSTGLSIQDIICAKLVYEKAKSGKTNVFKFF